MFVDELSSVIQNTQRKNDKYFGIIGRGNHFINIYVVKEIYNEEVALNAGLKPKTISILIHTGSRVKGYETYTAFMESFKIPDVVADEFNEKYLAAFYEARNYAAGNRTRLRGIITDSLSEFGTELLFDKTHNDTDTLDDNFYKLRKGTSNLSYGEIFIIPSNTVDDAYVIMGKEGLTQTYNTINHGCGRKYTRTQMFSKLRKTNFGHMFKDVALNVPFKKMIEEAPKAYKNIEDVIDSLKEFNLAEVITKLKPVGVIVERK